MDLTGTDYGGVFRGRRVLVTGGAGFIGSHLTARLIDLDAEVRIIDDLSTGHAANLPDNGVSAVKASILDDRAVRHAMTGCDFVFHEAAMVSVAESVADPLRCTDINLTGTQRLLEAARDLSVQRVIFASSAAAYGEAAQLPCREDRPPDCHSPYAASKVAGEALMSAFARCFDVDTVSLRYFNIFGPRQDPKSPYAAAIAAFADAFAERRRPTVFGTGRQTRDFTYIDNVVHANLLAAAHVERLNGHIMNIGTGAQITLLAVIDALADYHGVSVEPIFEDPRPGDVMHSVADISAARDTLGYEPIVDFRTGVQRTLESMNGRASTASPA